MAATNPAIALLQEKDDYRCKGGFLPQKPAGIPCHSFGINYRAGEPENVNSDKERPPPLTDIESLSSGRRKPTSTRKASGLPVGITLLAIIAAILLLPLYMVLAAQKEANIDLESRIWALNRDSAIAQMEGAAQEEQLAALELMAETTESIRSSVDNLLRGRLEARGCWMYLSNRTDGTSYTYVDVSRQTMLLRGTAESAWRCTDGPCP
jgi:hypothetical protein